MIDHRFVPGEVLTPDERCQVILRIYGEDKQCPRRALSNGRCKRHGGVEEGK